MINLSQETVDQIAKHLQSVLDLLKKPSENEKPLISKPFLGNFTVTQGFGENPAMYKPMGYDGHFGIDYATPWGTQIMACDEGIVSRVGFTTGNGNFIELKHTWGYSLYLHFKDPAKFQLGDKVARGQVIGYAGNTGNVVSTLPADASHRGTHLHFSIKVNDVSNVGYKDFVNPANYLEY